MKNKFSKIIMAMSGKRTTGDGKNRIRSCNF